MMKQFYALLCAYAAASSLLAQLDSALIAKYYFDNANANDDHTNGLHAIVSGASLTNDRFGNDEKAYFFDGVDDFMTLDDVPFRMGTSDFAFSFWIQVQDPQYSLIFSKRYEGDNSDMRWRQYEVLLTQVNNFGQAGTSLWSYQFVQATGPCYGDLTDELPKAWHHVVVNFRYGIGVECYLNNVLAYTVNTASCVASFDVQHYPLVIGYRQIEEDLHYKGKLDDIRIYRRALSSDEVDTLYNEPNPVAPANNGQLLPSGQFAYPNPTTDGILLLHAAAATVVVYDAQGVIVLQATNTQSISLQGLQQGIYYLHIQAADGSLHQQSVMYLP